MDEQISQRLRQAGNMRAAPQVAFSTDDLVRCKCGNGYYTQMYRIYEKKTPIIGEPPIRGAVQVFVCTECGVPID